MLCIYSHLIIFHELMVLGSQGKCGFDCKTEKCICPFIFQQLTAMTHKKGFILSVTL